MNTLCEKNKNLVKIKYQPKFLFEHCLNFTIWNAWSLTYKTPLVCNFILSQQTDLFMLMELWDNDWNGAVVYANFDIPHVPPAWQLVEEFPISPDQIFESWWISQTSTCRLRSWNLVCKMISSSETVKDFLSEISGFMDSAIVSPSRLIITGFDIPLELESNHAHNFKDRSVHSTVTHEKGHLLDFVITRASDQCMMNLLLSKQCPQTIMSFILTVLCCWPAHGRTSYIKNWQKSIEIKTVR